MKTVLLILSLLAAASLHAATNYIRAGASGANNGTSWADAYPNLTFTEVRGDTYYVADGTYGVWTIDVATSGSTWTYLRKATVADHGTSTGWSDTYGDGSATFQRWDLQTAYVEFDGATGGGTNINSYGFIVSQPSTDAGFGGISTSLTFPSNDAKHHLVVRRTAFTQPAGDRHDNALVYLYLADTQGTLEAMNLVIDACLFRDGGALHYKMNRGSYYEIKNSQFINCCLNDTATHKEMAKWDHTNSYGRIHGNTFDTWHGFSMTGGLVLAGPGDGMIHDVNIYNNVFRSSNPSSPGGTNIWSAGSRLVGGVDSSGSDHRDIRFIYNTVYDQDSLTAADLFTFGTWGTGNIVQNNLFVGNAGLATIAEDKGYNAFYSNPNYAAGATGDIALASDPFNGAGGGDFTLNRDIGVGTNLDAYVTTDRAGNLRTQRNPGAYEFTGAGGVPNNIPRVLPLRNVRLRP